MIPFSQRTQEEAGTRGALWIREGECKGWLYLELVIGTVYLLVVINFKRIQELEMQSEAPLYPDAGVAAQIRWVGLWVFEARDIP